MSISRSIVAAVRSLDPPGRFLEKNPQTGLWSDIGHKKAVEKTSQALRDGAASLRKQLSADLGDPDFLNAVFDVDDKADKQKEKDDDKEKKKKKALYNNSMDLDDSKGEEKKTDDDAVAVEIKSGKEMEKVKLADKAKPQKVSCFRAVCSNRLVLAYFVKKNFSALTVYVASETYCVQSKLPVKKGHRRVRSNPCSITVNDAKYNRRPKLSDAPSSPVPRGTMTYSLTISRPPASPRTPRVQPQTASQPCSPMDWNDRFPHVADSHSPASLGPHRSPYDYPSQSPHYSPYVSPAPRHNSYEHHQHASPRADYGGYSAEHRREPSRAYHYHHSNRRAHWSYGSYHQQQPQPPPSGQEPTSPVPHGPLPPGRHQFSPAGYRANPPDWTPRGAHQYHSSSGRYYPSYRDYHSGRWRRYGSDHDHFPHHRHYDRVGYSSSSLTVPVLGGERKGSPPPLSPHRDLSLGRGQRSLYGSETPPRPPGTVPREFTPPLPRRRIHRHGSPCGRYETASRMQSPMKEKQPSTKGGDDDSDDEPFPSLLESSCSSASKHFEEQDERRSSPGMVASSSVSNVQNEDQKELRTSPSMFDRKAFERGKDRSSTSLDGGGEVLAMDDISMSPIPFDRDELVEEKERVDPTTLMALPENILKLPISPFGPHDESALSSS